MPGPLDNLEEAIRELQDLYDDSDIVTTADKIQQPDPREDVKTIDAINAFMQRNPKADGGMLVQPSADGSRPGYKGNKTYPFKRPDGKTDYRLGLNEDTGKLFKKVGRDNTILTQKSGESKKIFLKRVSNYSTETAAARTDKFTKEIFDARNKIDSWTSNWLNKNLKNYGVRDFDKMSKDLKKDWKAQFKKLKLPTDKIKITTQSGFPNLSTSKGKESLISENPFKYNNVTFYTPENPSAKDKYMAQWKKIFYKNKIENTSGLKEKLFDYFEFMNLDKRGTPASGGPTIKSYKDIMDKDVAYILSEQDSGLKKGAKYEVFNSFDNLAEPYNKFTLKMNRSEAWKENADIIEKALGLKKNSIYNSMQKEQRALKKILDVSSLEGTGLNYSIDHGQGLAAAAKSGDVNLMKIALNDLIGTTQAQNTKAGFGGFEKVRGALIRDIQAGVNVKDNVKSLNKLTNDVYKDLGVNKNIYSIRNNKLVSRPLSLQTTREDRFKQYFTQLDKTSEGSALIKKKYGNLENLLLKLSAQIDPDCKQAVATGGRVGLKTVGSPEVCISKAKNYMNQELVNGIGTQQNAKTSLIKRILTGAAGFVKQNLSPKELLKMENLIGKPALYGAALFETGLVADDVLRKGKRLNVAAAESLFGTVLNLDADAAKAKNLLESNTQLSPAAKEYAQNIIDYDRYRKNTLSFPSSLIAKSMPGSDKYFKMQEDLKNKIVNTPDTGALDYQSALTESEAIFKAKPKEFLGLEVDSPDAPEVTPLTNKFAKSPGTRVGPMTAKQNMKIDLSPITYQNFKPNIPPKEDFDEYLRNINLIGQDQELTEEEFQKSFYKPAEFEQLMETRGFKGTQNEFAGGGIAKLAGVDDGPAPKSGPNPQGLQGLLNRAKKQ